jgi:hypothetical protein
MTESVVEYRAVVDFPGYRVGNDGSVWTCWRTCRSGSAMTSNWKRLKALIHKRRGYLYVNLSRDGGYKSNRIHRLVLRAFVGPCPDGMECRHLDGDPKNNLLTNLAWGTQKENREDCAAHEHYQKGEKHSQAKLTAEQVLDVRRRYAAGGVFLRELAEELGVSLTGIHAIIQRRNWTHI